MTGSWKVLLVVALGVLGSGEKAVLVSSEKAVLGSGEKAGVRCPWCKPVSPVQLQEQDDCPLYAAWDNYTKKCIDMPRWKIHRGEAETICYDTTWTAKGSAHMTSAYPTCVTVQYNDGGKRWLLTDGR
jgi:hypothetical protein